VQHRERWCSTGRDEGRVDRQLKAVTWWSCRESNPSALVLRFVRR
jgi:hypothetical protein